jgi:hypothetical protein
MGLRLESNSERDLDNRCERSRQEMLRSLNAPMHDVIMRPQAGCFAEQGGKVHAAQARHPRKAIQRKVLIDIAIDKRRHTLQSPWLQRRLS